MTFRIAKFALIPLIFGSGLSCKSVHSQDSVLQHTWGETRRGSHQLNCQDEESFDPRFQAYIHKHIAWLGASNPSVFRQGLEPEKFCAMPIEADEIDAGASGDGTLVINTGVLRVADTDAQFASAIAHELAHITLNHGDYQLQSFVELHPQYQEQAAPLLVEDKQLQSDKLNLDTQLASAFPPQILKALTELLSVEAGVFQRQFSMNLTSSFSACATLADMKTGAVKSTAFDKAQAQIKNLESDTTLCSSWEQIYCELSDRTIKLDYRSRTILSNWIETEADEVGLEFFLRAGYPPLEYQTFFRNIDKLLGKLTPYCIRGEANHPRDCWRAENAARELLLHESAFKAAAGPTVPTETFGEDLKILQQKYRTTP